MSDHVVQKEEPSQSPAIEMSLNEVVDAVRRIEERTAEELRAVKDAIASLLEQSAGSAADDDSSTRSAANVAAEEAAESAPPAVETQPPEPAPAVAPAPRQVAPQQVTMATPGGIANSLLGVELAEDYNVAADSQALLNGVWSGEPAAIGLVGQLLVFRSATIERMAQLLKDIGEAYYRWRPESAGRPDAFRDAVVASVLRQCDSHGVNNRIEMVQPGDRFDSARHHAKQRGMEVIDVFGWVVLRENGKVYTKASVSVR